jgi:VIT1/CCC1 family predicted Fe2+/Mn2+ transporter
MKSFVDEAIPLAAKTYNGLVLDEQLQEVEAAMRAKLAKDDIKQQEALDQLRGQLQVVKARFNKGLEGNTSPTASKKGMIKSAAGGLAGAFFLMLLVLLGQKVWQTVKSGGAK